METSSFIKLIFQRQPARECGDIFPFGTLTKGKGENCVGSQAAGKNKYRISEMATVEEIGPRRENTFFSGFFISPLIFGVPIWPYAQMKGPR